MSSFRQVSPESCHLTINSQQPVCSVSSIQLERRGVLLIELLKKKLSLIEEKIVAEEGCWCRSSKSCGGKSLVEEKYLFEENCFLRKNKLVEELFVFGGKSLLRKSI